MRFFVIITLFLIGNAAAQDQSLDFVWTQYKHRYQIYWPTPPFSDSILTKLEITPLDTAYCSGLKVNGIGFFGYLSNPDSLFGTILTFEKNPARNTDGDTLIGLWVENWMFDGVIVNSLNRHVNSIYLYNDHFQTANGLFVGSDVSKIGNIYSIQLQNKKRGVFKISSRPYLTVEYDNSKIRRIFIDYSP